MNHNTSHFHATLSFSTQIQRVRTKLKPYSRFLGRRLHSASAVLATFLALGVLTAVAATPRESGQAAAVGGDSQKLDPRLKTFFAEKEQQARSVAKKLNLTIAPEIWDYYQAADKDNWQSVSNLFQSLRQRSGQKNEAQADKTVANPVWQTLVETECAYEAFAQGDKKHLAAFADDIIKSIPPGSIYFGGTDQGRALITAFIKSHEKGDPFYVITQSALEDPNYMSYLRTFYSGRFNIPSEEEFTQCRDDYTTPVQINGEMAKIIFEQNPDTQFYIEESYPFDWMYSHLTPNGLIMKLSHSSLKNIPETTVQRDHQYWTALLQKKMGGWLKEDTSLEKAGAFVEKIYLKKDLKGFDGDASFIADEYSRKIYSKLRCAIAGVYAWRAERATSEAEKTRMSREADFAFRQAWLLWPYSPEVVFRYIKLLGEENRTDQVAIVVTTAAKFPAGKTIFQGLADTLKAPKN